MAETCKMVFLDINGKPSKYYESMLKMHGPEKAKELYIRHMLNTDKVRYSLDDMKGFGALKGLMNESDNLELSENNVYVDSTGEAHSRTSNVIHDINTLETGKTSSATDALSELTTKSKKGSEESFDESPFVAYLEGKTDNEKRELVFAAERQALKRMASHYMNEAGYSTFDEGMEHAEKVVKHDKEAKKEDPNHQTILERFTLDVFKSWQASTDYGTIVHNVLEEAMNFRNKLIDEGAEVEVFDDAKHIMLNLDSEYKDFIFDKRRALQGIVDIVIKEANAFSKKLGGKKVRVVAETKLKTKLLRDMHNRGIAGTADLLFCSEDDDVMIYDYKTKSEESVKNFEYASNSKMGGPWKDYANNARNKAQAQISIYGAILEEKGFNVVGGKVIMIPGRFKRDMDATTVLAEEVGELDWVLSSLDERAVEIKPVNVMHAAVRNYFKGATAEESAKFKIHDAVYNISGEKMELEFENLDAYIRNNWFKRRDRKSGDWFIQAKGAKRHYMKQWSDAEAKKYLTETYNKIKEHQKGLPIDVLHYFNTRGENSKFGVKKRRLLEEFLVNITPDTHDLFRAKDYDPEVFGAIGDDVLIAIDKRTGGMTFMSVLNISDNEIHYDSESGSRTSIYGKYLTDKEVRKRGFSAEMLETATTHEFVKMKLALGALAYMDSRKGVRVNIEGIKVGSIVSSAEKPISFTTVDLELDRLKRIRDVAGDDFDQGISKLLDKYKPSKTTSHEHLNKFIAELKANTAPLYLKYGSSDSIGTMLKEKIDAYESADELPEFNIYSDEFKDMLMSYRKAVFASLEGTEEAKYNDPGFKLINKACLEVLGFDLSNRQIMVDRMGKSFVRAAKNSSDYYAQRMHNFYEKEATRLREKFVKFDKEHQKLLSAALKESGKSLNAVNIQHLFDDLFMDSKDPENLMRLKDVSDKSLKPAQRAYIEFFNKHVKESLKAVVTKDKQAGIDDGNSWTEGLVPIKMRELTIRNENAYRSMKTFMKALTPVTREPYDPQLSDKFEHSFGVKDQSNDSGIQHSETRRKALNIGKVDEKGKPMDPNPNISKNLADILISTVMGAYKHEHIGRAVETYSAVDGFLAELAPTVKTAESRQFLEMWAEQVLHNRVKKEKHAEKMDRAKKIASGALFAGNIRQFGTEFFTGVVNSTGSLISNQVQRFLSKDGAGRFNMKDWGWAIAKTTTELNPSRKSLITHVIMENGMFRADPEQLQSNDYTKIDKVNLFSSKAMYGLNHMFFNSSITSTFLAEMKSKGVFEAYRNDGTEADPIWVYDELKDPRFYVYDSERGIGVPPVTKEDHDKLALYQATRRDALQDGLLNEDGSLKFPLTARQRSEIKQYATRLYGSFGKDAITGGSYTAVGRAFGSFKAWFMQKGVNYWNSTHIDDMYGEFKWVDDSEYIDENGDRPGGYYQWEGEQFEGICQSVVRLVSDLAKQGTNTKLSKVQKENLSKLLVDMMWLILTMTLITPMFNKLEDEATKAGKKQSHVEKNLKAAIGNALGEANIATTALSMTDNALPVVSLASNVVIKTFNMLRAAALTDFDEAGGEADKLFNLFGAGKSINTLSEIIND